MAIAAFCSIVTSDATSATLASLFCPSARRTARRLSPRRGTAPHRCQRKQGPGKSHRGEPVADAQRQAADLERAGRRFATANSIARRTRSRSHPLAAQFSVCLATFRRIGTLRQVFDCLPCESSRGLPSQWLASPKICCSTNRGPLGKPWWSEKVCWSFSWLSSWYCSGGGVQ